VWSAEGDFKVTYSIFAGTSAGGLHVGGLSDPGNDNLVVDGVASFGTNPASTGALRLPNAGWIAERNAANSADVNMLCVSSRDVVQVGTVPACMATVSAAPSIPNAAWTDVAFASESLDTDAMHDTVTNNNRVIVQTAGTYLFVGSFAWASNATGQRLVAIYKNATTRYATTRTSASGTSYVDQTVSAILPMAAGDYVTLAVYQDSGGALSAANTTQVWLSAVRLGA
jgi:hypothetical protein